MPSAPPAGEPGEALLPTHAADGEPLCQPPEPAQLCEAARRRLPEVEADLRRRLSGPDRSIEAVELEGLAQGRRPDREAPPALPDRLLEQGLLALCAAHLLGLRARLPLSEALALRGVRVQRTTLPADQPPRALESLGQNGNGQGEVLEVCRTPRNGLAARTLLALAAAGLSRPVVLVDTPGGGGEGPALRFAGLAPPLGELLRSAAAPHAAEDASAALEPLLLALRERNPWRLHRVAEAPWPGSWGGDEGARVRMPQLTAAGRALAGAALGRPPTAGEAFALACQALGAAERLLHLQPPLDDGDPAAPAPFTPGDEARSDALSSRLVDALRRLSRRPLLPGQDGEAPLFLRHAAQAGLFVTELHHPEELGRLLCATGSGYARLRVLGFPREDRQALAVTVVPPHYFVDGGDLRVHVLCERAAGPALLR